MNALTFENLRRWSPKDMAKYDSMCRRSGVDTDYCQHYLPVIQHLLENNIHAVVDIGCASGIMAYLFRAAGIRYVGIEQCKENMEFGEFREKDGSVVVMNADWPCNVPEIAGIDTCIALHSIGTRGLRQVAPAQLRAIKRSFSHLCLKSFSDTQKLAQRILGNSVWIVPDYRKRSQWTQLADFFDQQRTVAVNMDESVQSIFECCY